MPAFHIAQVNIGRIKGSAPLAEASVDDFNAMWSLNVRGVWLAMKHALPILSEGSVVLVNSSIAGQKGFEGRR